jgi:hypothetical protein
MAISGIKIPKKKARATVQRKKGAGTKGEPSWEGALEMSGEDYHKYRRDSHAWYYSNWKPADLYNSIFEWMKNNEYDAEAIRCAKAANASMIGTTGGILGHMINNGMPDSNPKHDAHWKSLPGTAGDTVRPVSEFLHGKVKEMITAGEKVVVIKEEEATSSTAHVPTIQERKHAQAVDMSTDIDEWLEGFVNDRDSFDPKGFDFKQHFGKQGVTQAHARKMRAFFETELDDFKELDRMPTAGQLKKMDELDADMWEQLKEGYDHLKKADIKKYTTAIQELLAALDFVIESAKATRAPRKAKPKSADKLVAKLKFCKVDDKYKLASIRPEDVIGANELWVFNVKTRKIGKYIATNIDPKGQGRAGTGLQVKGTTIIGFDEKLSVQKTLRKPDIQLKEFKSAGKVKLRTFLDDIPTTDTILNGRCNLDTILLKLN